MVSAISAFRSDRGKGKEFGGADRQRQTDIEGEAQRERERERGRERERERWTGGQEDKRTCEEEG
jgi:hypothetical protein